MTAHWATLKRLQTHPSARGTGLGRQLLDFVARWAAEDGLEGLMITVRGGEGLEAFYAQFGWQVCGRHEGALRIADGDDRDEVMMSLDLPGPSA